MNIMEKEIRKKTQKNFFKKAVLSSIAVTGILSVGLVAPNALQLLKPFIKGKTHRRSLASVNQAVSRLRKQRLIYFENTGKGTFVRLTEKGQRYLYTHIDNIPKPRRWDGKWRILIFDIKEKRRSTRDQLRISLVSIGFKRLQNSVWVYPYDCEDLIVLLKADFKIGKDVLYIIADKIENDKLLKTHFNL
jgi:CRISPR-associated endonuclease Cas2